MNPKLILAGLAIALLVAIPLAAAKAHDATDVAKPEKTKEEKSGKPTGLLNALQHVPDRVKALLQALIDGTHKGQGRSA